MLTGFLGMTNHTRETTRVRKIAEKQKQTFEPPGEGNRVLVVETR